MKNTKVYSVFPACGKSWLWRNQEAYDLSILDSDSSYFSWIWECPEVDERGMYSPKAKKTNERNPSFPQNYIDHIRCMVKSGKYDYIFVSSHESVRNALDKAGIDYTIVYPEASCKAEWVGRCYIREQKGESGCGPQVLYNNWENWIRDCYECGLNHKELVLGPREYLKHYLTY